MNGFLAKVSKAIAGGCAGAVTGGGVAVTYSAGTPETEKLALSALFGFIAGFAGVYFAPANSSPAK